MKIYKVGGFVRDTLLGLKPKDIDYVVVGATPEQMLAMGYSQVGADFPVFLHPETQDEYALARVERKVGVGYHGFTVDASPEVTLEDDLRRRDLTINSMAMDDEGNIYDYFGGQEDLKNKVLRHTSEAFSEDPLRVVRLARFFARYDDFTIANTTKDIAHDLVVGGKLNELSAERFWAELEKVFGESKVEKFFDFIFDIKANTHVNFFATLLDVKSRHIVRDIVKAAKGPNRLMTTVALLSNKDGETVSIAPKEVQQCAKNWKQFISTDFSNAESILKLLVNAGNFRQGDAMGNLFTTLSHALSVSFLKNTIKPRFDMFDEVAAETLFVTAACFPSVEGKTLGDAIKNGRIEVIQRTLDLRK